MNKDELSALRAAAEANINAAHIAASHPAAILRLLAHVDALTKERDEIRADAEKSAGWLLDRCEEYQQRAHAAEKALQEMGRC